MSFANDDMVRTLPPGFLAPADGNYADPVAQAGVAQAFRPEAFSYLDNGVNSTEKTLTPEGVSYSGEDSQSAEPAADLGSNNERLEDLKPDLVNALRELVRQYRQEGIVARRHEIRRIRQARLF